MHIDSHFDSGNIEVVEILPGNHANLRIKKDAGDEHMQWFYFRVDGVRDQHVPCASSMRERRAIPKRGMDTGFVQASIGRLGHGWTLRLKTGF